MRGLRDQSLCGITSSQPGIIMREPATAAGRDFSPPRRALSRTNHDKPCRARMSNVDPGVLCLFSFCVSGGFASLLYWGHDMTRSSEQTDVGRTRQGDLVRRGIFAMTKKYEFDGVY